MASIYLRKKDSPFIWIKFIEAGKRVQRSTGFKPTPEGLRNARILCAEKTADELRQGRKVDRAVAGWYWVPDFIDTKYHGLTARNYKASWAILKDFLQAHQISGPQNITRKDCFDYIQWRTATVRQSTAIVELRALSVIMTEAVNRDMIAANPCFRLSIRKVPHRIKPEIRDEECAIIREKTALVTDMVVRDMLFYSFEITRYQGCRLMETQLNPQRDIELFTVEGSDGKPEKRGTIFFRVKGGKHFRTMLHPKLIPLFEDLQARGRDYTWKTPEGFKHGWASARWSRFLKRDCNLQGISIHCNRVTVISELARNNIPESKARAMVGHSSHLSHRIYQRLRLEDLGDAMNVVGQKVSMPDLPPTKQ